MVYIAQLWLHSPILLLSLLFQKKLRMGRSSSSSSSIDSSNNPLSPNSCSSASSVCLSINLSNPTTRRIRQDLSTDLRLGLSISKQVPTNNIVATPQRDGESRYLPDWPPIKPLLRSPLAGRSAKERRGDASQFVKVYMDGIPIGRKLDLLSHGGYDDLARTLTHMFKTPILCGHRNKAQSEKYYVLTYEDREGDWMMVGDVPWEIFTNTVKRLKITRADRC